MIKVEISGVPESNYLFGIYKVGYQVNDPYSTYLAMNKPKQLTKQKVNLIKKLNDSSPVSKEIIKINSSEVFSEESEIRENDVFLLNLIKLYY